MWSADQYALFLSERTRPAVDLLARINLGAVPVRDIVDLGCGPGNSTEILQQRWPNANVLGVDNSDEMLARAADFYPDIIFTRGDISSWAPERPVDLIFSNAAFQWVPDHRRLLPRLASYLQREGALAMQMPANHDAPTHVAMREVASEHKWSIDLSAVRREPPLLSPSEYYGILAPLMQHVDIWQTTYFHCLPDVVAVVEWLKGTGLRPFIVDLSEAERREFLQLYAEKLQRYFLPQVDGSVLLPYPRLFVVAQKKKS